MSDNLPDLRGVVIQVAGGRLMLPNAVIAEILSVADPEPIEDAPDVEPTLESDLADGWDAWWREVDEVADRFERGRR